MAARPMIASLATAGGTPVLPTSRGITRCLSVRCDGQHSLQVMGFLVERGADADGLGADDGVVVGRVVAGRGQGAAGRSRGAGCAVVRSGVAVAGGAVLASGVRADGAGGVDGWPADDRDRDVRPVDGAQAALPVGVSVVGGGGVGLDPSAT